MCGERVIGVDVLVRESSPQKFFQGPRHGLRRTKNRLNNSAYRRFADSSHAGSATAASNVESEPLQLIAIAASVPELRVTHMMLIPAGHGPVAPDNWQPARDVQPNCVDPLSRDPEHTILTLKLSLSGPLLPTPPHRLAGAQKQASAATRIVS
ncbi:hypothetical protein BN2476_230369 [Paraburkholderia piptadeniae]|uniref:Uncharacterized protein n=1 Tax=Paraburkholderia piptadeniae TaxID=1701573 RepID=A0A1N7RYD1_9BURK|nr:hypothetical protein BN2476_230369 [Paraburkholderia piptadeniae]